MNEIQWESIERITERQPEEQQFDIDEALRHARQMTNPTPENHQILILNIQDSDFDNTEIFSNPFYSDDNTLLGFLFSIEELQIFTELKNYTVGDMSPTEYAGIMRATVSPKETPSPPVAAPIENTEGAEIKDTDLITTTPAHWNLDGKEIINASFSQSWLWSDFAADIEEKIMLFVNKKYIKVRYPGETRDPATSSTDDHLFIYIYAAPRDRYYTCIKAPPQIMGLDLWNQEYTPHCYLYVIKESQKENEKEYMENNPGFQGEIIYAPDSGERLAVYFKNNSTLFILLDIFRGDYMIQENRQTIFNYILAEFTKILTRGYCPNLVQNKLNVIDKMLFEKRIDSVFNNNLSALQENVKRSRRNITEHKAGLAHEAGNILIVEGQLDGLVAKKEIIYEKVQSELAQIDTIEQIESYKLAKNKIKINTKNILCYDELKKLYRTMGKYHITIDLQYQTIRWLNQTRTVSCSQPGMNHPHIRSGGEACQGSLEVPLSLSLSSFEYYNAVILTIAFLETANVADTYGKYITAWPKASKQQLIEGGIKNVEDWFPSKTDKATDCQTNACAEGL